MNVPCRRRTKQSFALISTMLVLLALTIIVVGFISSVEIERLNSRSYLNIYNAQLAAQSGLQAALNQLSPDADVTNFHYITALTNGYNSSTNPNLVLYVVGIPQTNSDGTPNFIATNILATPVSVGSSNCNLVPFPGEALTNPVGYVSITNNNAEVGRFAYWADDEGGKQNINRWGNQPRTNVINLDEMPLVQPNATLFDSADTNSIQIAHGTNYTTANAQSIPTVQTLNLIAAELSTPGAVPADVDNYTLESLSSYLTPEGYPKLDLTALKRLLDSNTRVFPGTVTFVGTANPPNSISDANLVYSDLKQGPSSARVVLVEELLNEDGQHAATSKNPWGYGNLQYLHPNPPNGPTTRYSTTQARQIVANILNYIDSSIVPITDGTPGGNQTDITALHPTFMGVKAWTIGNPGSYAIQGHPYLNYLGPGYDIGQNATGEYTSTVLTSLGVVNPWSAQCISFGDYSIELSAYVGNGVSPTYLPNGPLTPPSTPNPTLTPGGTPGAAFLLPTGLGTGYTAIFRSASPVAAAPPVTFSAPYEVNYCRIILQQSLKGARYLIQDIYNPLSSSSNPGPTLSFKYAENPGGYTTWSTQFTASVTVSSPPVPTPTYIDWHLVTDPRINFQTNNTWAALPSKPGANADGLPGVPTSQPPLGALGIFTHMDPTQGDGQQNLPATTLWWSNPAVTNHFPTYAEGYSPSATNGQGMPAMGSLGELGFIHTGLPWQTLHIQPDKIGDPYEDWKLLDYVKVGDTNHFPETLTNSMTERAMAPLASSFTYPLPLGRVDGLVNINTAKVSTYLSLFSGVTNTSIPPSEAVNLANYLSTSYLSPDSVRPYLGIGDLLADPNIKSMLNNTNTDFVTEDFMRRISNAITVQSQDFTIYVVGESRFKNRTMGKVVLRARVKLMESPSSDGGAYTLKPVVVSETYE